jgi:hypothetical protein
MPLDLSRLASPRKPWLHRLVAGASETFDALRDLEAAAPGRLAARVVRARKATTKAALLDEFAAALQFPPHFGANWDAFADCLADLSWLGAGMVVIAILDGQHLLEANSAEELQRFRHIVVEAAKWINAHDRARDPKGLHIIFHTDPATRPSPTRAGTPPA